MMKSLAWWRWASCSGSSAPTSNTGVSRFTFGVTELSDGIGFIVVAVGVFAVSEIVSNLGNPEEKRAVFDTKVSHLFPTLDDMNARSGPILRGTALGSFFGVLPGTGPAIASFASYMLEKKLAADPSRFGRGAIEGVRARNPPTTPTRNASSFPCSRSACGERRHGLLMLGRADHPGHPARTRGD